MIQRHMDLYPKNDQSQLKNIFLAESKINVNGVNVISPAELADFEKLHHKIFKNITFEIGAISHRNMKWTNMDTRLGMWTGEGKKSKKTTKIPVHLAFKWDGMKSNQAYFMLTQLL